VLKKQTEPPASFLEPVCNDLVTAFQALGQTSDAEKYQAELARMTAASGG